MKNVEMVTGVARSQPTMVPYLYEMVADLAVEGKRYRTRDGFLYIVICILF